jgi:hypothetical protein
LRHARFKSKQLDFAGRQRRRAGDLLIVDLDARDFLPQIDRTTGVDDHLQALDRCVDLDFRRTASELLGAGVRQRRAQRDQARKGK